jgi:hypothetical protein
MFAWTANRSVRLNLSARLISYGTWFFSHNKTASAGLSAAETMSRRTTHQTKMQKAVAVQAICETPPNLSTRENSRGTSSPVTSVTCLIKK